MAYTFNAQRLADLVRACRDREGIDQRTLAARAQSSASTISRIENRTEKLSPDLDTVMRVINACGIRLEEFIDADDESGKAQIQDISTQLRASSELSAATRQALAAIIQAVRIQLSDQNTQDTEL